MSASPRELMDALALALATLPGVEQIVSGLNITPNTPCIDIYPADPFADDDEAGFGDHVSGYTFAVRARVGTLDHDGAQDVLLDWMDGLSDTGVAALLEDDQTLSGLASSVRVTGPSGYRHFVDVGGSTAHLGCEWRVKVLPNP